MLLSLIELNCLACSLLLILFFLSSHRLISTWSLLINMPTTLHKVFVYQHTGVLPSHWITTITFGHHYHIGTFPPHWNITITLESHWYIIITQEHYYYRYIIITQEHYYYLVDNHRFLTLILYKGLFTHLILVYT